MHRRCAKQLLQLCQANGGVYIKAAQLVSTIQSVPKEYRECVNPRICHFRVYACDALCLEPDHLNSGIRFAGYFCMRHRENRDIVGKRTAVLVMR